MNAARATARRLTCAGRWPIISRQCASPRFSRALVALRIFFAAAFATPRIAAQTAPADQRRHPGEQAGPVAQPHYKLRFALGFVSSILAHESGHVIASYAVGGHPSFGFNKWRPTIYSGIDSRIDPHKQFIFSSAGLTVQTLLDETLLDVPHARGKHRGAVRARAARRRDRHRALLHHPRPHGQRERRDASWPNTSSLSKTQISLIFGGMAAIHAVRIHFKDRYAHFFTVPDASGHLRVGMSLAPD